AVAVGTASLMTSACIHANPPQSGVSGRVVVSPARPGPQREGERATFAFSEAAVELRDSQNNVVASAVADAQGQFSMLAPAGNYVVKVNLHGPRFPRCKAVDASVRDGQIARVDIVCDSGMR
ncbi:MAG: carboxypeptidase regulatory-like domain-containing protein, partial [Burkholderiales bacterium]|nr:carboxypeptidase regulatory-like domain-containing protein [Burkholderiales bacterium]